MSVIVTKPVDEEDKLNIYRFLYHVWVYEFGRHIPGMDHNNKILKDDLDDWADHLIALDEKGNILGCIRTNFMDKGRVNNLLDSQLQLDVIANLLGKNKISYTSHFVLAPHARGKTVGSLLVSESIGRFLKKGILADISYCALNLVHMYYQIGSRIILKQVFHPGCSWMDLIPMELDKYG